MDLIRVSSYWGATIGGDILLVTPILIYTPLSDYLEVSENHEIWKKLLSDSDITTKIYKNRDFLREIRLKLLSDPSIQTSK